MLVATAERSCACAVARVEGCPVIVALDEVADGATGAPVDDERLRGPFARACSALVVGSAPAGTAYGHGLVGAVKRTVGEVRLLVIGAVDFVSPRVAAAVERHAASGLPAAREASRREISRVPLALWRCVAVSPPASAARAAARGFAMGLESVEVADADAGGGGADGVAVRGVRRAAVGLVPAASSLRVALECALAGPPDGELRPLLLGPRGWSLGAGAPPPGPLVSPAFAAALGAAAAEGARARKRPREHAGGAGSAAAPAPAAPSAAAILAAVPDGHDEKRRRQREAAAARRGPVVRGPVRRRIDAPGQPWHGLSCDKHADPLDDPRVLRLRREDEAWAAAARAAGPSSVVIIVPFRDQPSQNRMAQLERFARLFPAWFEAASPAPRRWHVVVVEQSDDGYKFNRGKLLNVGFHLASKDLGPEGRPFGGADAAPAGAEPFDIAVMHDVDLIPTHGGFAGLYTTPRAGPVPIAKAWGHYDYDNYIGGITGFSARLFRTINGYPNNFWGWGGEDDDLKRRLEAVGYPPGTWHGPPPELRGRIRDLEEELIEERGGQRASVKLREANGKAETLNLVRTELLAATFRTWWENGLCSADYEVRGYRSMGPRVTVVTVDLRAAAHGDSVRLTDLPAWMTQAKRAKRK